MAADSPDPNQRYTLKYLPDAFSDERVCIGRTNTGLLQTIHLSADSRLDDVLVNVVGLAAQGLDTSTTLEKFNEGLPKFPVDVDPFDKQQVTDLNGRLKAARYEVDFGKLPERKPFSCPERAICYATKIPILARLYALGADGKRERLVESVSVEVIDPRYGSISVTRAFMTSKVTKLEFEGGVLTAVRIRKDSEALSASEFPLKVIERVLSVPANGIALAFGKYEEKKALADRLRTLAPNAAAEPGANGAHPPAVDAENVVKVSCHRGNEPQWD